MKKTRKIFALTLCLLMVISFAGCGAKDSKEPETTDATETTDEAQETAKEAKPISILCADDSIEGGALAFAAQLYKEQTGAEVELIEVPYEDMQTKLTNMIRAGNPPAVVRSSAFAEYSDFLLDLSETVSVDDLARKNGVAADGKLIAIPSNVTANGMLYNKTLFAQAGVEVPTSADNLWTWDDFIAKLNTVVDKSDAEYGMVWDHSQHRYATLLYQFGGSIYNEDYSATRIANAKSLAALEFFVSLFDDKIMPKSTWIGTEDPAAMFKTGKVAVHVAGNWKIPEYQEEIKDFEWGTLLMPYKDNRSSVLGGNWLFAIDGSGAEQEAKDFIKWFYSADIYKQYCEKGQYLPGLLGVNPEYTTDAYNIFVDELNNTPDIANSDWATDAVFPGLSWGNALRDNIDLVLNGDLKAQEALDATEKVIMDTYGIKSEK